jgi:hypothetical protein
MRQYERGVVFFLGKFEGRARAGPHAHLRPIQQMVRVSLRTVTMQTTRKKSKEAEAERERRAEIVAAEGGEYQAAVKLGQAADIITEHPVVSQLLTL